MTPPRRRRLAYFRRAGPALTQAFAKWALAKWALAILLLGAAGAATAGAAAAQTGSRAAAPVILSADEITFDETADTATARGTVELTQGERVLLADSVSVDRAQDRVTAEGNVVVLEPTGEVFFGDRAELSGNLKEGFISGIRVLLQDDMRIAAVSGRQIGGVRTELNKVVASPCRTCAGLDGRTPIWQIKARRVVHNRETHTVSYYDARLEVLGVPIFYTPYLSHPDPTVKRRTGILTPTFGQSGDLGATLKTPFFIVFDKDKDLLLDPLFTTKESVLVQGEYRQRFNNGQVRARLGGTVEPRTGQVDRYRGHFDIEADFDLSAEWRAGADLKATSDDTFLERYEIDTSDTLTSRLFAEGFSPRNHAEIQALYFQGLNAEDDQDTFPVVAPKIDFENYSAASLLGYGDRLRINTGLQALTRIDGTDDQRLSFKADWRLPLIGRFGDLMTISAIVQGDLYNVDNLLPDPNDRTRKLSGVTGRIFPQLQIMWRYPWVRNGGAFRQIIEPIVALTVAPNGGNPDKIPNEDSLVVEFDETNVFDPSRFPGEDRVEGGQHLAYGLRAQILGNDSGGSATAVVGQSIQFQEAGPFDSTTGLRGRFSDIVGKLVIAPNEYFDFIYKTRFDPDAFKAQRSEVLMRAGPPALRLDVDYVFFDKSDEFNKREEITLGLESQLTERWNARFELLRDLTSTGGTLSWGASLGYVCDCLDLSINFRRDFTRDRDVKPDDSFFVRVKLKNLGGAGG